MEQKIEYGYCQCGCGQKTSISKLTRTSREITKGFPVKYIPGHNAKGRKLSEESKNKLRFLHLGSKRSKISRENMSRGKGNNPTWSPYLPDTLIWFENKDHQRWFCSSSSSKKRLHTHAKAVWEYYNGPVPKGWCVHHKDGKHSEITDDRLENLMLLDYYWNYKLFPILSEMFKVNELIITNTYLELINEFGDDQLFKEICRKLIKLTDK